MPHCKNAIIINEIGKFFQKNSDNAMQRILTLLKATIMTDRRLGLHTESDALHKTSEKLILLVLEFARLFKIDEQIFIAKYLNDTEAFTKYIEMEFLQNVG